MTLPVKIGAVVKNATEEVRVNLQEFKGLPLCDIRVFGKFSSAKAYMPTPKGVSFNVAMLPEIIRALVEAEAVARDLGLMPAGKD